ncbi:MAG: ribosome silencing factor [Propionibacteriaceae bacterium]|nr:ribosome silencing factor [Propionibacteriaceae bacterium]
MTASEEAKTIARGVVAAAEEKLGQDIRVLDVSQRLSIADVFVIVTAGNERQAGAIVDAVEEKLLGEGFKPLRREGAQEGRWVLLDYGSVVVHVQQAEARGQFALDRLWFDSPDLTW